MIDDPSKFLIGQLKLIALLLPKHNSKKGALKTGSGGSTFNKPHNTLLAHLIATVDCNYPYTINRIHFAELAAWGRKLQSIHLPTFYCNRKLYCINHCNRKLYCNNHCNRKLYCNNHCNRKLYCNDSL